MNTLDAACFIASPLAIIGIVFLTIVFLDAYGQYRTFLNGVEEYGQTYRATITGISEDYIFVDAVNQPGAANYYFARTKYYEAVLPELAEGNTIEILAVPESAWVEVREPGEVILKPYTRQVHRYTGYLTQGPWYIWLLCLIIVSIHPEFLYLGFDIESNRTPGKPAERDS